MSTIRLILGDSFKVVATLKGITMVVTDPPYGLEFMGKDWDRLDLKGSASRPNTSETAQSRSTRGENHGIHAGKPAFDITNDAQVAMQEWHREWLKACFDILPSGGIIKAFSATRTFHRLAAAMEDVGFHLDPESCLEAWGYGSGFPKYLNTSKAIDKNVGVEGKSPEAARFEGWATALKPGWEPFVVGIKP